MTDSGAFQQSVYGDVNFSNIDSIRFQRSIGSEIIVPMDIATLPDTPYEQAEEELKITHERIKEAIWQHRFRVQNILISELKQENP